MHDSHRERVLELARRQHGITAREVREAGLHTQSLTRLVRDGLLERVAPGQYMPVDQEVTEHDSLLIISRAAPEGVFCLLTALQFHDIGTQLPAQVWIAAERGTREPALDFPPVRLVRFSGRAFSEGIEEHDIEGGTLRVYSIAKTLADLFKYRRKVGLDVPLEALNDAWQDRRFTMDELYHYAKICRVERVMQPYLEMLVA
jgi:predicted transcriptional regulator of viral defense system